MVVPKKPCPRGTELEDRLIGAGYHQKFCIHQDETESHWYGLRYQKIPIPTVVRKTDKD